MRMVLLRSAARRVVWFVGACCATAAVLSLVIPTASAAATTRRGGIEIGSKGVKATVVEVGEGSPAKPLMTAISNTTVVAGAVGSGTYDANAIRDTATEAGKFAKRMREEFGVPAENIRVIGSSGLPQASNRAELVDAVKQATGLAPMEFITPGREVELTISGLIPEVERQDAILMDIGSGNTKGGYIASDGRPVSFSIPFGSVTFANRVTKDAPGKPFVEAAEQLRPKLLEAPLAEQAAANPDLSTRNVVIIVGGAAYALATLMHPEAILQNRVNLSTADIAEYSRQLRAGPGLPKPNLTAIKDEALDVRKDAEEEIKNVGDTFTRAQLIAGAELLTALASTFKLEGKHLIFDRTAVTAWIKADTSAATLPPPPSPKPVVDTTASNTAQSAKSDANKPSEQPVVDPRPFSGSNPGKNNLVAPSKQLP